MIYLLAGYLWLCVHRAFEIRRWRDACRVEWICMTVTILYWLVASQKSLVPNRLNAAFLAFGAPVLLPNTLSEHVEFLNEGVQDWLEKVVLCALITTTARDDCDMSAILHRSIRWLLPSS